MFYHALIGNGGTPEPIENLEPVLLWTNSNPTAEFAAQTVSLDLSNYIGVIIECLYSTNNQNLTSRVYIKKGETLIGGCNTESYPNVRLITAINDEGVSFGVARDSNTHNDNVIPYKIYGVKEYIVGPVMGDLLYTNPSPTTEMTAIDIDGEYSKYSKIYVEATISTSNNAKLTAIIEKNAAIGGGIAGSITLSGSYYHVFRIVEFNNNIKILACKKTSGSTISTDNSLCIITKIYGIE